MRGRSSRLRINYGITEEIRKYAFAFLKDIDVDNLDDEYEGEERCQSFTHSTYPDIRNSNSASKEYAFIVDEVKKLTEESIDQKVICLVARTHSLLDDYVKAFRDAGTRAY